MKAKLGSVTEMSLTESESNQFGKSVGIQSPGVNILSSKWVVCVCLYEPLHGGKYYTYLQNNLLPDFSVKQKTVI